MWDVSTFYITSRPVLFILRRCEFVDCSCMKNVGGRVRKRKCISMWEHIGRIRGVARGVSSPHFAKVACFTLIFANDTLKVLDVTSCRHSTTTLEPRDDHEGPSSEIFFSRCFKGILIFIQSFLTLHEILSTYQFKHQLWILATHSCLTWYHSLVLYECLATPKHAPLLKCY